MSRKWTPEIKIPQDSNYIIRITDESFGPSKGSGNPMITLKAEVVSPEEVEVAGEMINIAGAPITPLYYVTQPADADGNVDAEKAANSAKRLKELYSLFELPNDNINPENPTLAFKGKVVYALLYPDCQERRKSPTAAQLAQGIKQGDVMINPKTKKPLVNNFIKVGEIFGLAELPKSQAF